MRLPHNSVVLVADGAKMLFFRNEGDAQAPDLKVMTAEQQADPYDRDIKTDRAGATRSGPGGAGASMEEPDYKRQAEERFAIEAAERINRGVLDGTLDRLVVVAPPRTLGTLRKHYHGEVEKHLILELAKDLTGHPVDKIEQILIAEDQ